MNWFERLITRRFILTTTVAVVGVVVGIAYFFVIWSIFSILSITLENVSKATDILLKRNSRTPYDRHSVGYSGIISQMRLFRCDSDHCLAA